MCGKIQAKVPGVKNKISAHIFQPILLITKMNHNKMFLYTIGPQKVSNGALFFKYKGNVKALANYLKLERHDDTDTCPAYSIVSTVKPLLKINRLSYCHHFSHDYS